MLTHNRFSVWISTLTKQVLNKRQNKLKQNRNHMFNKSRIIFYMLLCSILFFSSLASAEMKSTTGDKISVRTSPDDNATIKCEYGNGFPVKVLTKKGNWVQVQDFENDSGWIPASKLNNTPHSIVKTNKGKNKKINIRSGPGTNNTIVGQAYYGVVFEKKDQAKGWVKVKHESGLEGWIENTFLWGF